ncbi:MAG: efflux RND transporter periplasmic adaptor subunit [Aestuariivirga sp.]
MSRKFIHGTLGLVFAALLTMGIPVWAGDYTVHSISKTDLKAVFGRVESRDIVQARARLGGTIMSLDAVEGNPVKAGDVIATVVDDKLALQLASFDARLKELDAQLQNALVDLNRGKSLLAAGTVTKASVDALQTKVEVLNNQVTALQADKSVVVQQGAEGKVLAPASGRILTVPVTRGSVVMPGEAIARIAAGGYFLRISLPERHAAQVKEGDDVLVGARGLDGGQSSLKAARKGKLVKVYPEIRDGLVLADVDVDGLGDFFVGERTLVWIPVDKRNVIAVPPVAITTRSGIDYAQVSGASGPMDVAVITGETFATPEGDRTEILSGLVDGDKVTTP